MSTAIFKESADISGSYMTSSSPGEAYLNILKRHDDGQNPVTPWDSSTFQLAATIPFWTNLAVSVARFFKRPLEILRKPEGELALPVSRSLAKELHPAFLDDKGNLLFFRTEAEFYKYVLPLFDNPKIDYHLYEDDTYATIWFNQFGDKKSDITSVTVQGEVSIFINYNFFFPPNIFATRNPHTPKTRYEIQYRYDQSGQLTAIRVAKIDFLLPHENPIEPITVSDETLIHGYVDNDKIKITYLNKNGPSKDAEFKIAQSSPPICPIDEFGFDPFPESSETGFKPDLQKLKAKIASQKTVWDKLKRITGKIFRSKGKMEKP